VRFEADANDGHTAAAHLPTLRFDVDDLVVSIVDEARGEALSTYRIRGRVRAGHDRAERRI
jgi:hypothetical protein